MTGVAEAGAARCDGCASEIAPGFLACPGCGRLVHAAALKALAADAAAARQGGDGREELRAWRASLDLLPPASRQHEIIRARADELSREAGAAPQPAPQPAGRWKWLAALGPAGAVLWKFKVLIVVAASKGKLLLLGLTKASTLLSMLLSFGVYWTQWGGWFALGLVLSIYVHEMGHVAALRHFGIAATAPMFIPGLGALVRLRQAPLNARENSRVGLAGPIWGAAAAFVSFAIGKLTGSALMMAVAHVGAWINLFNLLPVWQLDGNRGFASLTTAHRWYAVAVLAAAWLFWRDGLLVLLVIVAAWRALSHDAAPEPDRWAVNTYIGLVIGLSLIGYAAAR